MKRAAFLFGSGISRESGGPMVGDISDALLNGAWKAHTDLRFYPDGVASVGEAKRAQDFLRVLKVHADAHLQSRDGRESNYEDLYAAALQILQDETCEIVNPLLSNSIGVIRDAALHLYQDLPPHIDDNAFASLADRATDLVQWVVYYKLQSVVKPVGMEALTSIVKATTNLDIFSLNHDLLIERQLNDTSIPFADGFSESDGNVVRFNWSWNGSAPVRLYKLHGSINWYRFRFPEYVQYARVEGNPEDCTNGAGQRLSLLDPKPLFLTGTTVKEQLYGYSLVGELFAEFRTRLRSHHTLICCGYGWLDKGINIRLRQWLYDAPKNRIVILHKGALDELKQKRFWYWHWDNFERAGKVAVVPGWLSDCPLNDLERFLKD